MNSGLNDLERIKIELTELSQQSQTQAFIPLNDLLLVVNKFNQRAANIENDMATYGSVSRDTLPSYSAIVAGDLEVDVPTVGNIDLSPITNEITASLQLLRDSVNLLPFLNVQSKVGQVVKLTSPTGAEGTVLSPYLQGITILTSDEIDDLNWIVRVKSAVDESTFELHELYLDRTVTLINRFVSDYGSEERFRFRNENDKEAAVKAFEQIMLAFKRKSYLRRKYGIRQGALQSDEYPKNLANVETFRNVFSSFRREQATDEAQLLSAFESARNFVELYDRQRTRVLDSGAEIEAARDE
ncbi:MAG: hypothetical protein HRT45_06745, partial [Bdellovibrionales bacterium]|nr:hypothetical protein [Bdellovibrionales bacterium]